VASLTCRIEVLACQVRHACQGSPTPALDPYLSYFIFFIFLRCGNVFNIFDIFHVFLVWRFQYSQVYAMQHAATFEVRLAIPCEGRDMPELGPGFNRVNPILTSSNSFEVSLQVMTKPPTAWFVQNCRWNCATFINLILSQSGFFHL